MPPNLLSDLEQYSQAILFLMEEGVFDIRSGSATLHFDVNGKLVEIVKTTHHRVVSKPN